MTTETPRLVVLVGADGGTVVEVDRTITIGRQSSNRLHVPDASASRRHCEVFPSESGVEIRDLDSLGGTLVNGVMVTRQELQHGDYIKVGESLFLYLVSADVEADAVPGALGDDFTAHSTVEMPVAASIFLRPEEIATESEPANRRTRQLKALVRIGVRLHRLDSPEALLRLLTEEAHRLVPAERVAVALVEGDGFSIMCIRDETGYRRSNVEGFSNSLAHRVLREGLAVMSHDVTVDSTLQSPQTWRDRPIRSILCVPLRLDDEALGVLQLDSSQPTRFDQDHLEWLCGLAGLASPALHRVLEVARLRAENQRLNAAGLDHEMVGESAVMRRVVDLIARVAPSDLTILVMGPSGTGKELVAQALHRNSTRASQPFVAVNCASLSTTLLESDLFGHERGAFTGAINRKLGFFELADGGTLFLDEIGEIPLDLQARLLRVLEQKTIRRVGGQRSLDVDVRIVAATNRDLHQAARQGEFREDLYFRLNGFSLTLPALKDRGDDVVLLAKHFTAGIAQRLKRSPLRLSAAACQAVRAYNWPGNVRELKNAIERAVVLSDDTQLHPEDLPEAVTESLAGEAQHAGYHQAVAAAKREILLEALRAADGNYRRAAARLGLNRTYLHRLANRLGVRELVGGSSA